MDEITICLLASDRAVEEVANHSAVWGFAMLLLALALSLSFAFCYFLATFLLSGWLLPLSVGVVIAAAAARPIASASTGARTSASSGGNQEGCG